MRLIFFSLFLGCWCPSVHAQLGALSPQEFFPVKVNNQWGLMDEAGQIVLPPQYDAIGEFEKYGYSVMQKSGQVGLLSARGKVLVEPKYDDIKVLDSLLIAVLQDTDWMVVNLKGQVILEKGYQQVTVWQGKFIGFKKDDFWGIADLKGKMIASPRYDEIALLEKGFFQTKKENGYGLLSLDGKEILPNDCEQINIYNQELFFFQKANQWGAVNLAGVQLLPATFHSYFTLSENFIKLVRNSKVFLYSVKAQKLITKGQYQSYYPFSKKYVLVKKKRQLGLMDWFGNVLLQPQYDEIQSYGKNQFRVSQNSKWGVVTNGDQLLIPYEYDYIAPLKDQVCVVKKGRWLGIVNFKGEELITPTYEKIYLEKNEAKAYLGGDFTKFIFNEKGELLGQDEFRNHVTVKIIGKKKQDISENLTADESDYQLPDFEWFYSPKEDKWGLRKLEDGEIHIEPTFDWIRMENEMGFTIVGIEQWNRNKFDRTTYRFDMVFGLVNNENGLLVTPMELLDIRLSDFEKGYPVARVIFVDGTHGLINSTGIFLAKHYAYIGEFSEGLARMSMRGKLSGKIKSKGNELMKVNAYLHNMMSPNYMIDYTSHDQEFRTEAKLICEDCGWGYLDTLGTIKVKPEYSFANVMLNGVGVVEKEGQKGAVSKGGKILLDFLYDEISFLENTQNQILKIYDHNPKYGLIDTLGQTAVEFQYDEIGNFNENKLAVMEHGLWGFVNHQGQQIIPCRFRKVGDFHEGLAAVQLGNKWGFIDEKGEVVIEFKYRRAGNFKDGLAWVASSSGVGYINPKDEMVIFPKFDRAYDFENNVARVVVDGKYGLIKRNGEYFLKPKYPRISRFNEYGLAIVQVGSERVRYALISRTGDLVTSHPFQEIRPFKEGLAVVRHKNKYGFVNIRGELHIPNIYSKASGFSEGLAAVQNEGLCGFIDKKGNEVIPLNYSRCLDFKGGNAVVYKGLRKAGLVDKEGNEIIKPGINRLLEFSDGRGLVRDGKLRFYYITEEARLYEGYYEQAREFQHNIAAVRLDGQWGIINQKGMQIIPPKYDKIEAFENGFAKVRIKGFTGIAQLNGEVIVDPQYEYISYAGKGLFRVEKGDKIGYFDASGNWVWELQK